MLVILAHGEAPERLCAAIASAIAAHATVSAELMPWGSLLLVDAPHARSERWLVAGRPQRDPWGLPLGDYPLDEAVAEYERYGAHAAQLGSGPFVAVDLVTGRLLRAPNGIVPAYRGMAAAGLMLGTSEGALRALARDVTDIPPGGIAGPAGAHPLDGPSPRERLGSLRWQWLHEELTARVARLGPLAPADPDCWLFRTGTGEVVFLPPLHRDSGRAAATSPAMAARLWSRTRLRSEWLFAPVLERPMHNTIALMGGSGRAT